MVKKIFVALVAFIFLLSACNTQTGPAVPTSYETASVRVTINDNISYAPLLIAKEEGYFEDYGLNVEFVTFDKASEAVALLLTGQIDIYAGTLNAGFLNAIAQEPNIKAVADRGHIATDDLCTYQAILIRKDLYENGAVTGPEAMAGKILAAKSSGIHAYLLDTYLRNGGLTFADIQVNDLPDNVIVDAFDAKTIDGMVATEPTLSFILGSGTAVTLAETQSVIGSLQTGVIAFGKDILQDRPEVGARFLAAYLKGVQQYNEGKTDRNLAILHEQTSEEMETLNNSCWPAIRTDGTIDFAGVQGYQQWAIGSGELDQLVTEEQFYDPKLLLEAQKLIQP